MKIQLSSVLTVDAVKIEFIFSVVMFETCSSQFTYEVLTQVGLHGLAQPLQLVCGLSRIINYIKDYTRLRILLHFCRNQHG